MPFAPDEGEDVWAWAERQVAAPINRFDLEHRSCLSAKVLYLLHVPAAVSMLLGMLDEYAPIPVLRLASDADLEDALRILAPVATGEAPGPDIDARAMTTDELLNTAITVKITAQRLVAILVPEVASRDRGAPSRERIHASLLSEIDARLAALPGVPEGA